MAFHLISTMVKPIQHSSMSDWQSRSGRMCDVAVARRADAFAIRNSSSMLRSESRIEGEWANYESNEALDLRIAEVNTWRDIISNTFENLIREMSALEEEKRAAEVELDWQAGPISAIREILFVRDCHLESEMTHDRPATELKNELYLLETNQRLLADRIKRAWEKLSRLQVVRSKVEREIQNKMETVDIDNAQRALDRKSNVISLKLDPLRAPKDCCSYENWLVHTKNLRQMAENEMADTVAVRESLFICREKSHSMFEAQEERTEFFLRNRIFETQRAFNELEWQQLRTREEIKDSTCEIQALEEALHDKTNALKLAETRLENRTERCITERCLDDVYDLLSLEVEKLRQIRRSLVEKLNESKANFDLITYHAEKIDQELEKKQHALINNQRTLEVRKRFKIDNAGTPDHNPCVQTDRNIELTHTEQIIPKK